MNMREDLLKLRPGFPKGHTQLDACIILPEIIKADALIMASGKQNDIAFKGAQCRSNRMRIGCLGVVIKFYTVFLSDIFQFCAYCKTVASSTLRRNQSSFVQFS